MNFFNRICLSQAGSIQGGGGPVGPAVETLSGNTGGPISPTLNNINVVADSTTFTGVGNAGPTGYLINGSGSTLALQPNAYAITIPASTTGNLITLAVGAGHCVTISAEIAAYSNDVLNQAGGGYFIGSAYNAGFGAVVIPSDTQSFRDIVGVNILEWNFQVTGGNVFLNLINNSVSDIWNVTAYIRYTTQ